MATLASTDLKLVPIQGANELFSTTGSPTPPNQGQDPKPMAMVSRPSTDCLGIYSIPASPEFSIGDLRHLGEVMHIGKLAFEMTFEDPARAEVLEFVIEIASPDRSILHEVRFATDRSFKPGAHSRYVFSFTEEEARCADRYFVRGNRLMVRAKVAEKIVKGQIQIALRDCR